MRTIFKILKNRLWFWLSTYTATDKLLKFYVLAKDKNIGFVSKDTSIVIEGYPRSGNTYAYSAFYLAQEPDIRESIAHHVHGLAQLKRAKKLKIPAMVIIRSPIDSVSSLVIRSPFISAKTACHDYYKFYSYVSQNSKELFIVDFERVINDFSEVVDCLNLHSSTRFNLPESSDSFKRLVSSHVKKLDAEDTGLTDVNLSTVGLPTEERKIKKTKIKEIILNEASSELEKCNRLYEKLSNKATTAY